jgi:Zn-dependent peptidase ImmA (M78 family)
MNHISSGIILSLPLYVVNLMNIQYIKEEVRKLHKEIWYSQDVLWPNQQLAPTQMLDPRAGVEVLGLTYEEHPDLGNNVFSFRGQRSKVAGLVDRQSRKIAVSTEFQRQTIRFTAAHEIGHWVLHPYEVMFRDKPIDKYNTERTRPIVEKEADYFAACFLMLEKLLSKIFQDIFGSLPFVFDDLTAFNLGGNDSDDLLRPNINSLDREFALARCTSFNGKFFTSLSKQFGVSNSAMAIRIKELKLIRWP